MATRVRHERMIQAQFPEIRWLRAHTSEAYEITVYACTEDLVLPEALCDKLNRFLKVNGLVSCRYKVKHYFELRNDNVFPVGLLPDTLEHLALTSGVTHSGFKHCIEVAFPMLDSSSIRVDKNVVFVSPKHTQPFTELWAAVTEKLLAEFLPMGSVARITQKPYAFDSGQQ